MLKSFALISIRFYQRGVSPWLPTSCRFYPTCSTYAHQAVERHGVARGLWLALRRLSRCRPLGGSGYDPVPPPSPQSDAGAISGLTAATSSEGP